MQLIRVDEGGEAGSVNSSMRYYASSWMRTCNLSLSEAHVTARLRKEGAYAPSGESYVRELSRVQIPLK